MSTTTQTNPATSSSSPGDEDHALSKANPFRQQNLDAWRPILTPAATVAIFLGIGLLMIPIGIILVATAQKALETSVEYDGSGKGGMTSVTVTVAETMRAPVFFYYKLENFYQNHLRYSKSKSDNQLLGNDVSQTSLNSDCTPLVQHNGVNLNPCGLFPQSMFNDTFTLFSPDGKQVVMNEKGIAWEHDKLRYGRNSKVVQKPDPLDEHFMVWMRPSPGSTFRKLWAKIENQDLEPGTYTINIQNNFPVSSFQGKKYVVLATMTWMGSNNYFLGSSYILLGFICLFLSMFFVYKLKSEGRKFADTSKLKLY
eukprot:GILI01006331.1.p1 GENE.GILI01006331.1~~GILI01006331.1.p1  ORF type:complete len:311 (-),score=80.55 GILI01006331.1:260-1192(-)